MSQNKKQNALDVNDKIAQSEAFISKYKKQLIIGIVAVVVIVGGTFAYIYGYAKPREEKAQELLGNVMQKYVMKQDFENALKGDAQTPGLTKIAETYGSTDAGNVANYEAGICYFQMGKIKEAITSLEKFSTKGDNTISAQAVAALANCYAADKQLDKAVDTFKKAAKKTDVPALCAEYTFQAAQILESQKKNEDALALYQQIKADYPESPLCVNEEYNGQVLGAVIDKYIERLTK